MDLGASCGRKFVNRTSGTSHGYSIVEGHEYAEPITDQNRAGGWTNSNGSSFTGPTNRCDIANATRCQVGMTAMRP
jgi:serine protease